VEIIVEDFDGLATPVGLTEALSERVSVEHTRAVLAAVLDRAPGTVTALALAAEASRMLDGDLVRARELLDHALEISTADSDATLAEHLLEAGEPAITAELLDEALAEDPEDETHHALYAQALEAIHARTPPGRRLRSEERAALERFADRSLLYRLRDELREFTDATPQLRSHMAETMREWLSEAEMLPGPLDPIRADELDLSQEALAAMAVEHSWLTAPEADDAGEEGDPRETPALPFPDSGTPLAALAGLPQTPPDVAQAAGDWYATCTYGLWQVRDPEPRPGVWLTDLVSGTRRYVAIDADQLEGLAPWAVILGPVVAVDGIWRTGSTFASLRPGEGDSAAAAVRVVVADLLRALEGKRPRGPRRPVEGVPHGVLVDTAEPADPLFTSAAGKITGYMLPSLFGELTRARGAAPRMTNMDGDPVTLITASVRLADDPVVALREHPDFIEEDGELVWWGRALTEAERAGAQAELSSHLESTGGPFELLDPEDEPSRWVRGRLRAAGGDVPTAGAGRNLEVETEVEVNSQERLEALLEVLSDHELAPELRGRRAIDPAQDLAASVGGFSAPVPFGTSPDAVARWAERWPEETSPPLGGVTPRAAARRRDRRPGLEAVLREFEHDAHLLALRGLPVPDLAALRAELEMECWWEPPGARATGRPR
jgi:hypothetical protein